MDMQDYTRNLSYNKKDHKIIYLRIEFVLGMDEEYYYTYGLLVDDI